MDTQETQTQTIGTYSEMFAEYLAEQTWIKGAELPLVFHLRMLCVQLDGDSPTAALSSAYLQAFSRLDKRRPDYKPIPGEHPDQRTIFDELD